MTKDKFLTFILNKLFEKIIFTIIQIFLKINNCILRIQFLQINLFLFYEEL